MLNECLNEIPYIFLHNTIVMYTEPGKYKYYYWYDNKVVYDIIVSISVTVTGYIICFYVFFVCVNM